MNKQILVVAAVLGMLAIILGAFAAHGLKDLISESSSRVFETAVRYQMYHAILLLFVGTTSFVSNKAKKQMLYLVLFGLLFFSGSLYALATNELTAFDFKKIGFITPIGGLLLIIAWLLLLINFLKMTSDKLKN